MPPRFPTEIPKIEPKKMPLPTLQKPPMTEVSETPFATPWQSRTSEGGPRNTLARLKGIETVAGDLEKVAATSAEATAIQGAGFLGNAAGRRSECDGRSLNNCMTI